jgi:hypothetical protein
MKATSVAFDDVRKNLFIMPLGEVSSKGMRRNALKPPHKWEGLKIGEDTRYLVAVEAGPR